MLGLTPGEKLPGKIVVKQQVVPIIDELPDQGLITDDRGIPVKLQGQLVYEHCFYTEDAGEGDVFIMDSNGL